MKRILLRILFGYLAINLLLAVAFFAAGGAQMLRSPDWPPTPASASPQSDVKFMRELVLRNERGASAAQRDAFAGILDAAPTPTDADQMTLLAMRALAAFDNAHTTVMSTANYRLPVRLHWVADGLIIVKTAPEAADLLGHRVDRIGGQTPEALLPAARQFVGGGTDNWLRYRSEFLFTAPTALAQLGAEVIGHQVELTTTSPEGEPYSTWLTQSRTLATGDPFWDFRHLFPDNTSFGTEGWVSLLSNHQPLPLYLQDSQALHSLHSLPEAGAIYLRMNASFADKSESLTALEQRIRALVASDKPKNLLVDFRFNRGGDYTQVLPIVEALAESVPATGQLYLIVGPNTFSAGLIAASQFKRYLPTRLTVVGSEVGDRLRFRAEGFYPTLPNTGIQLYLTKGWTDLKRGCGWFDDCWPVNKLLLRAVGELDIDLPAQNTWLSYRTGKDELVQAVLQDIARREGRDGG